MKSKQQRVNFAAKRLSKWCKQIIFTRQNVVLAAIAGVGNQGLGIAQLGIATICL